MVHYLARFLVGSSAIFILALVFLTPNKEIVVSDTAILGNTELKQLSTVQNTPLAATTIVTAPTLDRSIDARFSGLLSHIRWLMNSSQSGLAGSELARINKQFESLADDVSDGLRDVRDDVGSNSSTLTLSENISLGSYYLSGDGDDEGILINSAGGVQLTAALLDSFGTAGSNGYVLLSTGTSTTWVATSTLGIGASAAASGIAGAIQFSDGSGLLSDASNFFWDDTNNRLGIGTTTPNSKITVDAGSSQVAINISGNGGAGNGMTFTPYALPNQGLFLGNQVHVSPGNFSYVSVAGADSQSLSLNAGIDTSGNTGFLNINRVGNSAALIRMGTTSIESSLYVTNNVGIGTTTPDKKLNIYADSTAEVSIRSGLTGSANILLTGNRLNDNNSLSKLTFYNQSDDVAQIAAFRDANDDAGALRFYTQANGSSLLEKMRLTSTGQLGLGTTTPSALLSVGSVAASQFLVNSSGVITDGTWNGDAIGDAYLTKTGNWTGTFDGQEGSYYLDANNLTNLDASDLVLTNGYVFRGGAGNTAEATSSLFIADSGNVGIGTTTPDRSLHVYNAIENILAVFTSGDANAAIAFEDPDTTIYTQVRGIGNDIALSAGGADRLYVTSAGNIGIGTTTPDAKLTIAGAAGDIFNLYNSTDNVFSVTNTGAVTINSSAANALSVTSDNTTTYANIWNTASGAEAIRFLGQLWIAGVDSDDKYKVSASNGFGTNDYFTIDNAGNVGIGTTTPGSKLTIVDSSSAGTPLINIIGSNGNIAALLGDGNSSANQVSGFLSLFNAGTNQVYVSSAGDTYFNGGNVGIGTTTPYAKLSVTGDLALTGGIYDNAASLGTSGMVLQTDGTGVNWVATSSLGISGGSSFSTSAELLAILGDETGTGFAVFSGSPTFTGTVSVAASTFSSTLTLSGTAANIALGSNYLSGDGADEGLFVNSTGLVGIGNGSQHTPLAAFHIKTANAEILIEDESNGGFLRAGAPNSTRSVLGWQSADTLDIGVYDTVADTTITSYLSISGAGAITLASSPTITTTTTGVGAATLCWDGSGSSVWGGCTSLRQYKDSIENLSLGLETLLQLRPVEFDWNENIAAEGHDFGFIAEEVEAVNPLLVEYGGEGGKLSGVKYNLLTSLIIKAVQELRDVVFGQGERLQNLENENELLKNRLEEIESGLNIYVPTPESVVVPEPDAETLDTTETNTEPTVDIIVEELPSEEVVTEEPAPSETPE